jgi:hypothetical protein
MLGDYQEPLVQPPLLEPLAVEHVRVGAPPAVLAMVKSLPDFDAATIV